MKYIDEYRDADLTRKLLADIQKMVTRPWTLMEVCGGQTHSIIKSGLDRMLPADASLRPIAREIYSSVRDLPCRVRRRSRTIPVPVPRSCVRPNALPRRRQS